MKYFKLTDQDNYTRRGKDNETLWGEGVTHTVKGKGGDLCSPSYIHFYFSPELAVLLNPIHADIKNPKLWEVEATCEKNDHNLKGGSKKVTTVKEIPLPQFTTEQRVKFGILCALKVYKEESFVIWANKWLDGEDRSYNAANSIARASYYAVPAYSINDAARAVSSAADAATFTASAQDDYAAGYAAVYAAYPTAADVCAANAANHAADAASDGNFIIEIAKNL